MEHLSPNSSSSSATFANPNSISQTISNEITSSLAKSESDNLKRVQADVEAAAKELGLTGTIRTSIDERGLVIRLLTDKVLFASGQAVLEPEALPLLRDIGHILATNDLENPVRVEGNTDNVPISTSAYPSNWELSAARAAAVLENLIRSGFPGARLSVTWLRAGASDREQRDRRGPEPQPTSRHRRPPKRSTHRRRQDSEMKGKLKFIIPIPILLGVLFAAYTLVLAPKPIVVKQKITGTLVPLASPFIINLAGEHYGKLSISPSCSRKAPAGIHDRGCRSRWEARGLRRARDHHRRAHRHPAGRADQALLARFAARGHSEADPPDDRRARHPDLPHRPGDPMSDGTEPVTVVDGPEQIGSEVPSLGAAVLSYEEIVGRKTTAAPGDADLTLVRDRPVELAVDIGRTTMTIRETLAIGPGSLIQLNRLAGEPVDLLVNGHRIARGVGVAIDEVFGLRVTEIVTPQTERDGS